MDALSAKLRIASVLVGFVIAIVAALIVMGVAAYFFGYSLSTSFFAIILIFVLFIDILQWLFSPYIIGAMYRLTPVKETDAQYQWLIESVQKVATYNNQRMPRVYIAEIPVPNAFAYGSPLTGKRMAITRGLLNILDRDEIEAVIGHEIGHLKHHDAELLLAIGLIPTLIFYLGYALIFSGGGRDRQNGYAFLIAILLIAVSFIFNIMILGVNRMRESYADVNSANTVPGGAENLQSALAKIAVHTPSLRKRKDKSTSSSISSMLMIYGNSEQPSGDHREIIEKWKQMKIPILSSLFSDHPHPAKRIQMLERIRNSQNP